MADLTTIGALARVHAMAALLEQARALELEGCTVRVALENGRLRVEVDLSATRAVDPREIALDRWGKGETWPEGLSTAPAEVPTAAPVAPSVKPVAFRVVPAAPIVTPSEAAPPVAPIETGAVRRDAVPLSPGSEAEAPTAGHGAPWTHAADVELGLLLSERRSWEEISAATGRSVAALQQRVKRYGGRHMVINLAAEAAADAAAAETRGQADAPPADCDPDAPGALEAHLDEVSPSRVWSREMDRELIRLACLGWTADEVDNHDLTGVKASSRARKATLTDAGRWSIYEVGAALGLEPEAGRA